MGQIQSAPKVIAEIGCNHKGDMQIAKEMIQVASFFCKADIVKFQKRTVLELLSHEEYNAPHPNPMHSYGNTYGEHRDFLELDVDQHRQLKEWSEEAGIEYSTSVWDVTSAREMMSIDPLALKVPSACNTDEELIKVLCNEYRGEIHVSLGMTKREEEERLIGWIEQAGRLKDAVVYSCTSGYPVPFEDICLMEIPRLVKAYGGRVKEIGFSGHHLGIAVDIAALTLGAKVIERHFTLDRTWKGTDHAASLEPDGLRRLVRDLRNVNMALTEKREEILEIEAVQRKKLKRKIND